MDNNSRLFDLLIFFSVFINYHWFANVASKIVRVRKASYNNGFNFLNSIKSKILKCCYVDRRICYSWNPTLMLMMYVSVLRNKSG